MSDLPLVPPAGLFTGNDMHTHRQAQGLICALLMAQGHNDDLPGRGYCWGKGCMQWRWTDGPFFQHTMDYFDKREKRTIEEAIQGRNKLRSYEEPWPLDSWERTDNKSIQQFRRNLDLTTERKGECGLATNYVEVFTQ